MREIPIREGTIRLGQALKLAGVVSSGAEAKALLAQGLVSVNGEPDGRRGRQLHLGDEVTVTGEPDILLITSLPRPGPLG